MHERCPRCGLSYEREPGFYLGSIYVNYGVTALIVTAAFFALFFTQVLPQRTVLAILMAFCVAFPLWFFRYARSLWLGFDQYWDPNQDD